MNEKITIITDKKALDILNYVIDFTYHIAFTDGIASRDPIYKTPGEIQNIVLNELKEKFNITFSTK